MAYKFLKFIFTLRFFNNLIHVVHNLVEYTLFSIVNVSVGPELQSVKQFLFNNNFWFGSDFSLGFTDFLSSFSLFVDNCDFSTIQLVFVEHLTCREVVLNSIGLPISTKMENWS